MTARPEPFLSMVASHRWALTGYTSSVDLSPTQIALLDLAEGLLERGVWTLCTWRVEQALARRASSEFGCRFEETAEESGTLGYLKSSLALPKLALEGALLPVRTERNRTSNDADLIWNNVPMDLRGSSAELHILSEVLLPVLGLPLIDFLRLQPRLAELGLDAARFGDSRADFAIYNGCGISLVIEVDGPQHQVDPEMQNDSERDAALGDAGWDVWRIPTAGLPRIGELRNELKDWLEKSPSQVAAKIPEGLAEAPSRNLLTCCWGATVVARVQFLVLEALRAGVLPWDSPWNIQIIEHDTDIGALACDDMTDWFGRLRRLHGQSDAPAIRCNAGSPDLIVDISIRQPHCPLALSADTCIASSRPAQCDGGSFVRKFTQRLTQEVAIDSEIATGFLRDLFRKRRFREGQIDIIARIFAGRDVVALLPTGAGKSLPYQFSGLLLGGLTIYVSPLRSLIQDQYERLGEFGIDRATMLMSGIRRGTNQGGLDEPGLRFVLVTPERFLIAGFRDHMSHYRAMGGVFAQIVIDECHCVSEWGHEFRPAYLSLSRITRERTRKLGLAAPLVALTGTASSIVLSDVMRELGINDSTAVVRSANLDRPEIDLICLPTKQVDKARLLGKITKQFFDHHLARTDGLLVFCPFVGGGDGVMGAGAAVSEILPDHAYRFYTGQAPDWAKYAAVKTRKSAATLSSAQVREARPNWASSEESWDEKKGRWQREYISGSTNTFRVMIATKAFGMGIDKASIREVIHWAAPTSPEAYYQEVGRACRDGRKGRAIMLFSDEYPHVANQILDPGATLDDAKSAFEDFQEYGKFRGGDFIRTFFFHDNTFAGESGDFAALFEAFGQVRNFADTDAPCFNYRGEVDERHKEYALVRLMILGVVEDYTKDYRLKSLELRLSEDWRKAKNNLALLIAHYARRYREYIERYEISPRSEAIAGILAARTVEAADEAASQALIAYVYSQIERKRRQATRKMLELARVGIEDAASFRRDLLLYLQLSVRFTATLEDLAKLRTVSGWESLVEGIGQKDDLRELHGACQRVLESYPTHPALLFLSCCTRLDRSTNALDRDMEEIEAALKYGADLGSRQEVKCAATFAVRFAAQLNGTLREKMEARFGVWLLENGFVDEAMKHYAHHGGIITRWLAELTSDMAKAFPEIRGF